MKRTFAQIIDNYNIQVDRENFASLGLTQMKTALASAFRKQKNIEWTTERIPFSSREYEKGFIKTKSLSSKDEILTEATFQKMLNDLPNVPELEFWDVQAFEQYIQSNGYPRILSEQDIESLQKITRPEDVNTYLLRSQVFYEKLPEELNQKILFICCFDFPIARFDLIVHVDLF